MVPLIKKEIEMRVIIALCIVSLLSISIWAKQASKMAPAANSGVKVVSAAELAAIVAKQPKDANGFQAFIELSPYAVNMEHRIQGQGAAVHEREAELFYVIDGAGTFLTGGKLIDEKRTNESNLSGSGIQGGVSKRVSKGDWMIVPEGVPHQFPAVEGSITLMSLHLPRTAAR
jgi:mannose-6-phosphate isomerase-like protein (cupin superfamily)